MLLKRPSLLLFGVASVLAARGANAAPDRAACFAASEEGQTLKIKGSLTAARAKLSICADRACPALVRTDCVRWIEQIDKLAPTIVIGAQDARTGHDLVDVRVSLDGAPFATSLDGRVVAIDPGPHTLRFEADHYVPHEERIVALEGEQGRVLNVRLVHVPTPEDEPPPPVVVAPPRARRELAPEKTPRLRGGIELDASLWILSDYYLGNVTYYGGAAAGPKLVGRLSYVVTPKFQLDFDLTGGAVFLGSDVVVGNFQSGDAQNFLTVVGRVEAQFNLSRLYSIRVGGDVGTWVFFDQQDFEIMFATGTHASFLTFHFGKEQRLTLSADETLLFLLGASTRVAFEQTVGFGYTF